MVATDHESQRMRHDEPHETDQSRDGDGRSELRVAVSLEDAEGQTVAEMTVNYAFRPLLSRASNPSDLKEKQ